MNGHTGFVHTCTSKYCLPGVHYSPCHRKLFPCSPISVLDLCMNSVPEPIVLFFLLKMVMIMSMYSKIPILCYLNKLRYFETHGRLRNKYLKLLSHGDNLSFHIHKVLPWWLFL